MSSDAKPINVQILDKDYMVGCPEDERAGLMAAAKYLDVKMREARDSGKVIGSERIAVITALNIAHELLQHRQEGDDYTRTMDTGVRRLKEKIDKALQGDNRH